VATIGSLILNLEARGDRLEAELKKARQSIGLLQAQIKKLGGDTQGHTRDMVAGFGRLSVGLQGLIRGFQTLAVAAAGFVGVRLAQHALAFGDSLGDTAAVLGVSVEQLQRWRFAGEQVGVEAGAMDGALARLNRTIAEARTQAGEARDLFQQLGISLGSTQAPRDTGAILNDLADRWTRLTNVQDQNRVAMTQVGRTAQEMGNFFRLGSQGIADLGARADRLGIILSQETVAALGDANDALGVLGSVLQAQVQRAVATLAPDIARLAERLALMAEAWRGNAQALRELTSQEQRVLGFFGAVGTALAALQPAVSWLARNFTSWIAELEVAPIQRQFNAVQDQIVKLRQQMQPSDLSQKLGLSWLFGERPAEEMAQMQRRMETLVAIRDRLNSELMRIRQGTQLGPVPPEAAPPPAPQPPRPAAGPPIHLIDMDAARKAAKDAAKALEEEQQRLEELTVTFARGQQFLEDFWDAADPVAATARLQSDLQRLTDRFSLFGEAADLTRDQLQAYEKVLQNLVDQAIDPANDHLQALAQQYQALRREVALGTTAQQQYADILRQASADAQAESLRAASLLQESFASPMDRFQKRADELREMLDAANAAGLDFSQTFAHAMALAQLELAKSLREGQELGIQGGDAFAIAQRRAQIELARTTLQGQALELVAGGITDAWDQTVTGIIQGTVSVRQAFASMVQSIGLSLSKLLLHKGIELLVNLGLAALGGALGAAGGGAGVGTDAGSGVGASGTAFAQHGGLVQGPPGVDRVPLRATRGEFVMRRAAVAQYGVAAMAAMNQGQWPGAARQTPASGPGPVTINNIVVRNDQEAQAKRQELEQLDGHIVNVITRQILNGDNTALNRSIRMVHGGGR
jgi:hypothetical protein